MPQTSRSRSGFPRVPVAAGLAILAVLAARLPFLLDPRFLDADEAVVGLMGLGILRGEFPLYYWGAGYPSSLEAFVAAGWLAVIPSARIATKLAPVSVHLAAVAALAWLAARAARSARAGVAVAVFWALVPWPLAQFATQAFGRSFTLAFGALMWAAFLCGRGLPQAAALGFLAGIGYWNDTPIVLMAVPPGLLWLREAALRLLGRRGKFGRGMVSLPWVAVCAAAFLAGIAPHLYGRHAGLAGMRPRPAPGGLHAVAGRMHRLAFESVPGALSSDLPPAPGTPGFPLRAATAGIAAGAILLLLWRVPAARRAAPGPGMDGLVFCASASLVLFVMSWSVMGHVYDYMARRYLVLALPGLSVLCGLGGWALWRRSRTAAAALAAAAAACLFLNLPPYRARFADIVHPSGPLVALLDANGIRGAFANYWIASTATLETRERVIVAQSTGGPMRHGGYYRRLAAMDRVAIAFNPAWFPSDGPLMDRLLRAFAARGLRWRMVRSGGWTLVIPRGRPPVSEIDAARAAFPSG